MDNVRAIKGGIIGACVGLAVWVTFGFLLGGAGSWMALVVGGLTGLAVNRWSTAEYKPVSYGGLAAMFALIAILAGKYCVLSGELRAAKSEIASFEPGEENMIACIANKLSAEIESQGQSSERLVVEGEFPNKSQFAPAVWRVAEGMWKTLGDSDKTMYHDDAKREHAAILGLPDSVIHGSPNSVALKQLPSSFGLMDFLCIPLGLAAAFFLAKRDGGRDLEMNSTIDRLHRSMDASRARQAFGRASSAAPLVQAEQDMEFKKNVSDQIAELRKEARAAASGLPVQTPAPAGGERKRRPPVRRKVERNRG